MQRLFIPLAFLACAASAPLNAQSRFDDVHPVFRTYCADCHSTQGNGAHNIASGDIQQAFADSQLPSYFVPGQTKGFAMLVRIQNGDMPLGAGCSGDPTLDASNPLCLEAVDLASIQTWIQSGQPGPAPITGTAYCFGDGSGAPCPCGNLGASDGGCANSVSWSGGALVAVGSASLAADTLLLRASRMPNGSALYFQGTNRSAGGAGQPFGDGLLCTSGAVVRLGTLMNGASTSQFPPSASLSLSVLGSVVTAASTRHYQVWYRDAAAYCSPATFNLTSGTSVTWLP
ncbi:MAG: hypothetical protein SGI72_14440 [Planctomycetota bacterium]|nr:hypothetical protein [Planctomycetota bacterium]